jgi:heme exporter protein B
LAEKTVQLTAAKTLPRSHAGWWGEVLAVFVKDLRSELRTRAALTTILLFSIVTLVIVSVAIPWDSQILSWIPLSGSEYREELERNPEALPFRATAQSTQIRAALLSGMLWVILFFSAMAGLPRAFVKEEEMRTAAALRLAARPTAVFWGKLLFNCALMVTVAVVLFPFFLFLMRPAVADWVSLLLFLMVGVLTLAGSATIFAAMVARAGGKAYLMLPISAPLLLTVLVPAINGTANAIYGKPDNNLLVLVSYLVAMVACSSFLFEKVWSDA